MINRVVLAAIAGLGVLNGLYTDHLPAWRQLLFVALTGAAYLHGRHRPARHDGLLLAVAAVPAAAYLVPDVWRGTGALICLGLFVVLPWLAGRFRRQQAELVAAGRDRVARLERERELVAEHARLRERARIAADLHDSLGHELALIALRAGALELAGDLTKPHQEAAAALRVAAVTATDRLRRTVGLLRDPASRTPTEPPEESVEDLVGRARDAGMTVELGYEGQRAELPPLVDRAVHRVVQESLTNAARHAPGAGVAVRIGHTTDGILVAVHDGGTGAGHIPGIPATGGDRDARVGHPADGIPAAGCDSPAGGGTGLAGLRERIRMLGGTVHAGPRDGGFAVTARIPYRRAGSGVSR